MDQLHRQLSDKLKTDTVHLETAVERGDVELALAAAKRARRHATMLVRHLAEYRDTLQS